MQTLAALRAELDAVLDERDYLRQTVDRLLATNAILAARPEQPTLAARRAPSALALALATVARFLHPWSAPNPPSGGGRV